MPSIGPSRWDISFTLLPGAGLQGQINRSLVWLSLGSSNGGYWQEISRQEERGPSIELTSYMVLPDYDGLSVSLYWANNAYILVSIDG